MLLLKLSAHPLEKGRRSSLFFFPWMGKQPTGDAITQTWTTEHLPRLLGARLNPHHSSGNATNLTLLQIYISESLYLGSSRWKMKSRTNLAVNEIRRTVRTYESGTHTSRSWQGRCVMLGVFMIGLDLD